MLKPSLREALHLEINQPGTITKARLRSILNATFSAEQEKPTARTQADLAQLPNQSVIRDKHGDVMERRAGEWCGYECSPLTDAQMAKYLPATILEVGKP